MLFITLYAFDTIQFVVFHELAVILYLLQMEADKAINDPNSHIINIGQMVEVGSVTVLLGILFRYSAMSDKLMMHR